ncbi:MAG TPA: hypothetical protein VIY48_08475 [Candidatus Paceibacterota bacterium]
MTLSEATRVYQIADEHLRTLKSLELHSMDAEYEHAAHDREKAKQDMILAWLEYVGT